MDASLQVGVLVQIPGVTPHVWGSPGSSKSRAICAIARRLGWSLTTLYGSDLTESDLQLPVPSSSPERGHTFSCPERLRALGADGRPSVLFLDELSNTSTSVRQVLLHLLHTGEVGDHILPPTVHRIGAGNYASESCGATDMEAPLARRLVHVQWPDLTAAEIADYLVTGEGRGDGVVPRLDLAKWESARPLAGARIGGFLRSRPEAARETPEVYQGRTPLAYACGATWALARDCYAAALAVGEADWLPLLIGCVGEPRAIECAQWIAHADLPDPEALLAAPTSWEVDPDRVDVGFAVLGSVAAAASRAVEPAAGWRARWIAGLQVLEHVCANGIARDVAIPAIRTMIRSGAYPAGTLSDPTAIRILAGFREITKHCGVH